MNTKRRSQARHRDSGRYSFDGDMSRLCVCGHPLGAHTAEAPHECLNSDRNVGDGSPCDCLKFKLAKSK